MEPFAYKAYAADGRQVRGEIEATTREAALTALEARGLVAYSINEKGRWPALSLDTELFVRQDLSRKDAALFYRELAALLTAGLRVEEALSLIAGQMRNRRQRDLVKTLTERTRRGESLSQSMRLHPKSFAPFECAIFQNGEKSGDIAGAAKIAADMLEREIAYGARLGSALIYPAILSLTAIGAILIVSLYLAPAIAPMFERSGAEPPAAFTTLLGFSAFIRNFWWAVILGGALVALGFRRVLKRDSVRVTVEQIALRVPMLGVIIANAETARLCRALGLLLKSGAPISEAMQEAGEVCRTRLFGQWARRARADIREGARFSETLEMLDAAPAIARRFAEIGEKTGHLDQMLDHAADHADAAATRASDALMNALPPLLTVVMGAIVGGLIAIVLSTILSANELVFDF